MKLGVSGTRFTITRSQALWLAQQIEVCDELHHGACVGADEESHYIAITLGKRIVVHPPNIGRWMMAPHWNHSNVTVLPAWPYHDRNRNIVNNTDRLAAAPNRDEPPHGEPLGGTWFIINYAVTRGKRVDICMPDGTVDTREPKGDKQ